MRTKQIYTDGSCSGNPGPGGSAFIATENEQVVYKEYCCEEDTDNNRMEIKAICQALRYILVTGGDCNVEILSDSKNTLETIKQLPLLEKRNFRKTKNRHSNTERDIHNKSLWQEINWLLKLIPNCNFNWIPGHFGIKYQEEADNLARLATKKAKNNLTGDNFKERFKSIMSFVEIASNFILEEERKDTVVNIDHDIFVAMLSECFEQQEAKKREECLA